MASGDANNPFLVNPGPMGDTTGPDLAVELVMPPSGPMVWRFHARNQLGSLMGVSDENGKPVDEYEYGENGEAFRRPVAYYGAMANFSSVTHDSPSANQSTITMVGTPFSADQFNGMQIVVSVPNDANDRLRVGTVIDTTTSSLIISDAGTYDIAAALYSGSVIDDFVLFDFNDSTVTGAASTHHLGGAWSGVSYSGGTGLTTLTDSGGNFQAWLAGCMLCPDVEFPSYFKIVGVTSTTLTVTGDLTTIASSGEFFRVHIPPGANKITGTLAEIVTPAEEVDWDVAGNGSHYLWASYRYTPAMLGFTDDRGLTIGAQTGTNKLGQYHCWNREYDPTTGRWVTTDSIGVPTSNYCNEAPVQRSDASGLWSFSPASYFSTALAAAKVASLVINPQQFVQLNNKAISKRPLLGTAPAASGVFRWQIKIDPATSGAHADFSYLSLFTCFCDDISFIQITRAVVNKRLLVMPHVADIATSEGFSIDYLPKETDPYYGVRRSDPKQTQSAWVAEGGSAKGSCGGWGVGQPASTTDNPAPLSRVDVLLAEFETCGICVNSGEILGCIKWGLLSYPGQRVVALAGGLPSDYSTRASDYLKQSARNWNHQRTEKIVSADPPWTGNNVMGGTSALR